jgi:hypothetical protein
MRRIDDKVRSLPLAREDHGFQSLPTTIRAVIHLRWWIALR